MIINKLEDLGVHDSNEVDWRNLPFKEILSEGFMRKYLSNLYLSDLFASQRLSEDFIEEHTEGCIPLSILHKQKLSTEFLERNYNGFWDVDLEEILTHQILNEAFLEKHLEDLNPICVTVYQVLSEQFIYRNIDRLPADLVGEYQCVSEECCKKLNLKHDYDNWMYKNSEFKKERILETNDFECHEDYFIAYKGVREDRYSKRNFLYQYLPNETYTCHADHTRSEDSFGLYVGTEEMAKRYAKKVIKVKINYDDLARVTFMHGIRCKKLTVLN